MTIHLNLTPNEAYWLSTQTAGLTGIGGAISKKLSRQALKFVVVTQVPAEVKFPATGNINLADPHPPVIPPDELADRLEAIRTKAINGKDPNCMKIAVIKAIRELCGGAALGLADAKGASETWPQFIAFVRANNRLPLPGFYYDGMK